MKNLVKTMMLTIVSLIAISFFTGCDNKMVNEPLQVQSKTTEVSKKGTGQLLPWEKARYDYSYLENKVKEANQYLTKHKLTLKDLKQFHDIGNLIFGDYLAKIMTDFEHRNLGIVDDKLFINEYAKNYLYSLLFVDFHDDKRYSLDIFNSTPNIRIMTNHIGERNEWVFIPIRVYFPAPAEFANDSSFDENGGNDTRWRYYVLQLKRDSSSYYGWKISYHGQVVNRVIDDEILWNAWFVWLNAKDDFSAEGWKDVVRPTEDEWKYYIGETDSPYLKSTYLYQKTYRSSSSGGKYDRQAAASYAYRHATNYNPDYKSFTPNDCANFVSQCLFAGGLPTDEVWGLIPHKTPYYGTDTWVGANKLYNYLKEKGYGYPVSKEDLVAGYYEERDCVLEWGDVLAMNKPNQQNIADNVWKTHVMIISHSYHHTNQYYDGSPRYKVCGHTHNRPDVDLMLPALGGKEYVKNHVMGLHITY